MKKIIICILFSLSSIILANNLHRYIWANYKQFGGKSHEVQSWYEQIFASGSYSLFTNKGYLHFLHDKGNFQRIIELMPQLQDTFKNDADTQFIFVHALKKTGKTTEAEDLLIRLSRDFKTHPELILNAAETLIQRKELNNALALIDDYLNSAPRRPHNFIFHFIKGQVFMNLRDFSQARAQIEQCLDSHPRFPQGWLLLATLEEQLGKLDDAIKGYTSYLEIIGSNKQIEQHILALTLKQKTAQANRQLLFVNQSSSQKAVILFERKQYQAALTHVESCLTQQPRDMQLRLLKVQILATLNNVDELLTVITGWIAEEPHNAVWYQTLHLLSRAKIPPLRVITALSAIHTQHPHALLPQLYLADLHTKTGSFDQAITYHIKAKNNVRDLPTKVRLMYQLAVLYYEKKEYNTMLATLNELNTITKTYAPAANLQAYYYATAGNDLKKAQEYFNQAYAQDRGNPHFLDTQAVIFYKQHHYDKALKLLQPIAQKLPHDSSILIHLAKTYYQLGNHTAAYTTIEVAQKYAQTDYEKKTSSTLAETWKKT